MFLPGGHPPLSGLDLSLLTVSALHQLLSRPDDVIQLATPTRQLSQEVLKQEVNSKMLFYFENRQSDFMSVGPFFPFRIDKTYSSCPYSTGNFKYKNENV